MKPTITIEYEDYKGIVDERDSLKNEVKRLEGLFKDRDNIVIIDKWGEYYGEYNNIPSITGDKNVVKDFLSDEFNKVTANVRKMIKEWEEIRDEYYKLKEIYEEDKARKRPRFNFFK